MGLAYSVTRMFGRSTRGAQGRAASAEESLPRLLIVTPYYWPNVSAGGPVKSLQYLNLALADRLEISVITTCREFRTGTELKGVLKDRWNQTPFGKVYYSSSAIRAVWVAKSWLEDGGAAVVYLNSVFSIGFTLLWLVFGAFRALGNPHFLVAPRGELSPGALQVKRRRKKLYLGLARWLRLFNGVTWHATSELEKEHILREFGTGARVEIAPNIVSHKPAHLSIEKVPGFARIAFVSRVVPKKNLLYAIKVLSGGINGRIEFDIYGPIEDEEYWHQCRAAAAHLPSNIEVSWKGLLEPDRVVETMSLYHLFFLPTFGENFGHAIVEAFYAGCPALISDQTPWRGLESCGVGWDIPLSDEAGFRSAIQRTVDMEGGEYDRMRRRVVEFAENEFSITNAVASMEALVMSCIESGGKS